MRKVAQVLVLVTELRTQGLLTVVVRGQRTGAAVLTDRQPCNQPGTAGLRGLAGGPEKGGPEGTGGDWEGTGGAGGEGGDPEGSGRDQRGRERSEGD